SAVCRISRGRAAPLASWPRLERPVQYTVAPCSPSAMAIPRPAPRVAPATSATRPSKEPMAPSLAETSDDNTIAVYNQPGVALRTPAAQRETKEIANAESVSFDHVRR